jgi:hypothetical protein
VDSGQLSHAVEHVTRSFLEFGSNINRIADVWGTGNEEVWKEVGWLGILISFLF